MTPIDKIEFARAAITDLKQATGVYQGHPRAFCIHVLGHMSGRWAIRVWQFDGQSSRPERLPDWSNFFLDELRDFTLRDGEWHRGWRTGNGRPHGGFESIDTVVDPRHAAEIRQFGIAAHEEGV